jgi:hypothetical protein
MTQGFNFPQKRLVYITPLATEKVNSLTELKVPLVFKDKLGEIFSSVSVIDFGFFHKTLNGAGLPPIKWPDF